MKQFALALLGSVAALTSLAQNLVPNPSFEEYLECPQGTAGLHEQVIDWYSWQETPDFFHTCNNEGLGTAGVPENAWGTQWPITGDAYAGIFTYVIYAPNGREYIAAMLNEPLQVGQTYYMMFYVSMFDGGSKNTWLCAAGNIGMRFFKDPQYTAFPPDANPLQPDNFAHLNHSEILDDFINWTLVEGWFTADDTYDWVAIGNFFTDDQTDITMLNNKNECVGIYYIENVCVATSPEECEYLLSTNTNLSNFNARIYPNPAQETVRLTLTEGDTFDVYIYDVQGRLVENYLGLRSDINLDVSLFHKGVYVLRITNNQLFTSIKLVLQ